jgi:hypothetical protein
VTNNIQSLELGETSDGAGAEVCRSAVRRLYAVDGFDAVADELSTLGGANGKELPLRL